MVGKCVANVTIAEKTVTLPVDAETSYGQIATEASLHFPGHAFVFSEPSQALDFYSTYHGFYTIPYREQFLEQVKMLAKMREELDDVTDQRIQYELIKLDSGNTN